jgi:hypothetical protein
MKNFDRPFWPHPTPGVMIWTNLNLHYLIWFHISFIFPGSGELKIRYNGKSNLTMSFFFTLSVLMTVSPLTFTYDFCNYKLNILKISIDDSNHFAIFFYLDLSNDLTSLFLHLAVTYACTKNILSVYIFYWYVLKEGGHISFHSMVHFVL